MRVDRLEAMEQYVIDHGSVSLENIAQEFNISTNTVRRDILELLSRNNIKKVYGGVAVNTPLSPLPYITRTNDHMKSKDADVWRQPLWRIRIPFIWIPGLQRPIL
mgnify:CR=1 FL=1